MQSDEIKRPRRLKARGAIACALWLAVLAGCTVGPNFKPPAPQAPAAWNAQQQTQAGQASVTTLDPAELAQWWTRFNDPVLTSLIERAIRSNLDVRQAEARIRQARAARGVAASALWPEVDLSASYNRGLGGGSSRSQQGAFSGSGAASGGDTNLFQVGLDASWELDLFGGIRRGVEAATADIDTAIADRRDVLVSLVAEAGTDYMNLRGFQQQIAIANKNLAAQRHTAEITRKRFEAGFIGGLDVANAYAQVATTESLIPGLEASARSAIYSLSVLLGSEPAALVEELGAEKPIPATPPEIPVGLPSDLLRRRPDIRKAEAQLHSATARVGVATADLFPKVSLTGNLGTLSADITKIANWSSRAYSVGPTLTWPIFDAGRIRANIEVQNALEEQALLAYQKAVLAAFRDVETALIAYIKEQEHYKALAEAVRQNVKAVDLAGKLYVGGRSDFLNVLLAQRSLFATEDALVQSTRTLVTNLTALYKALGGGWETAAEN